MCSTACDTKGFLSMGRFYTRNSSNTRNSCIATRFSSTYSHAMSTIHTRIREARQAKGLSTERLAALVGVSYQTIQQWENGKTAPKRQRLAKVADALGVTVEFLSLGTAPDENPDHAPIRLVDAKASAGKGQIVFS